MLQGGHAAMGRRSRFTPAQKRDAVLAVLTKRKTVSEVCRELQVSETSFNRWREQALEAIDEAMKDKADQNKGDVDMERRLAEAERTIGQLAPPRRCSPPGSGRGPRTPSPRTTTPSPTGPSGSSPC